MYTLEELVEQNRDIKQLCEVLGVLMPNTALHDNEYVIDLMNLFREKVWMHLVFEDKTVYAELARHSDDEIKQIAHDFHQSARGTKKDFAEFMRRWQHREDAPHDNTLCEQCGAMFQQILERVEYENKKMFPLVEEHQNINE